MSKPAAFKKAARKPQPSADQIMRTGAAYTREGVYALQSQQRASGPIRRF